jgi:hypothetical protein
MSELNKLQAKLFNRIGMKVIHGTKTGMMCTFNVEQKGDGLTVSYLIDFEDHYEWVNESELVFIKGTEV